MSRITFGSSKINSLCGYNLFLRSCKRTISVITLTMFSIFAVNRTCEICGSVAHNVAGAFEVQMTDPLNEASDPSMVLPTGPSPPIETRNFWQGHRFLNFLLACMVFAFVISWLFHFNVPS